MNSEFWKEKVVLLTGGGGSLARALTEQLLRLPIHAVRLFDVSESSLYNALQHFGHDKKLRFLQGDVRNKDRLALAMRGANYVIGCAALKSVDIADYNPIEAVDVNVNGVSTMIQTAMTHDVEKCLNLSSDKSILSSDAGVYHATKFLVEKITVWANSISDKTKFSCIRPANFVPSDMSVFQTWHNAYLTGVPLPITSASMSRYFISLDKAARFTLRALELMKGGEIWIPPAQEHNILSLAKKLSVPYALIGPRANERTQEDLMTPDEQARAVKVEDMWVLRS